MGESYPFSRDMLRRDQHFRPVAVHSFDPNRGTGNSYLGEQDRWVREERKNLKKFFATGIDKYQLNSYFCGLLNRVSR